MSDEALRRLEGLRRQRVERARLELAAAQRTQVACVAAQREARAVQVARERELDTARREFAAARSVYELRCAAARVHALQVAVGRAAERVTRCEAGFRAAERHIAECQDEVRAGELGRRALSRTLEQRAADVSLRTERRREEEADDAFRARSRPP